MGQRGLRSSGSAQTLNRVPDAGCAAGKGLLVTGEHATAALQGAPLGPFLSVLGPVTLGCTVTVARAPCQPDPGPGGSVTATRIRDGAERAARCRVKREMQAVDQRLAQQLMRLRAQLHRMKVEQACHQHKEMLDDATFGLEGCEEDSDLLCNIPPKAAFLLSMPLKHIGVTRMNINSRRFSLC
ncbi:protein FAM167B isoform X4 [Patagioenas fasciata]|uniref:protein FAM167B isoform X4 n=1 Tax=Patagioenas fasciata TaxID=372321 RepID=UPI003A9988A8